MQADPSAQRFSIRDYPAATVFAIIGAIILWRGFHADRAWATSPGPGSWPVLVGCGLLLSGLFLLFSKKELHTPPVFPEGAAAEQNIIRALAGFALACVLWLTLFISLGWLPATALALLTASIGAENSWRETATLIVLLVAGLYLGLDVFLRSPLPGGLFERLLDYLLQGLLAPFRSTPTACVLALLPGAA